jgi:hypothetical protein
MSFFAESLSKQEEPVHFIISGGNVFRWCGHSLSIVRSRDLSLKWTEDSVSNVVLSGDDVYFKKGNAVFQYSREHRNSKMICQLKHDERLLGVGSKRIVLASVTVGRKLIKDPGIYERLRVYIKSLP